MTSEHDATRPPAARLLVVHRNERRRGSRRAVCCMLIALGGFTAQTVLQELMRPYAIRGLYFQMWSSEALMQTVSIEDLRDEPIRSLWNIHIQPPAFDAIRAVLARVRATPDAHVLLENVDRSLYVLWALTYALCGALVFWWLSELVPTPVALVAAVAFLAHPACIFYATLLETTFLSATLVLWTYYLLWRCRRARGATVLPLTVATLALFFTRSVFQWPAFLVFACSMALLSVPLRKVAAFLLLAGGIAGLYLVKQHAQFGILTTSSFSGLGLCHSVGCESYMPPEGEPQGESEDEQRSLPRVLARKRKLLGAKNYNTVGYLGVNAYLMHQAKRRLAEMSAWDLFHVFVVNARLYFKPSSSYSEHFIVDRMPRWYRSPYDRIFSAPIFPALIVLAAAIWLARAPATEYVSGVGLCLPAVFTFAVSVLGEWGENMRFKFFLEPVLFVFVIAQCHAACEQLRGRRARDLSRPS